MIKNGVNKAGDKAKAIQKILITQPRPESEKSPYFELQRKYSVELDFHPFIRLEGIPAILEPLPEAPGLPGRAH